jgi:hypothetical protein
VAVALHLLLFAMGFTTSLISIRISPRELVATDRFVLGKTYLAATIITALSFFSGLVCVSWVL